VSASAVGGLADISAERTPLVAGVADAVASFVVGGAVVFVSVNSTGGRSICSRSECRSPARDIIWPKFVKAKKPERLAIKISTAYRTTLTELLMPQFP
jgi:hypothetical protein